MTKPGANEVPPWVSGSENGLKAALRTVPPQYISQFCTSRTAHQSLPVVVEVVGKGKLNPHLEQHRLQALFRSLLRVEAEVFIQSARRQSNSG